MGDTKLEHGRRGETRRLIARAPVPSHPPGHRLRAVLGAALPCAIGLTLASGCTNEQVVSVDIATVRVTPSTASAIEGEDVQLTATVLDENQVPLEGATVAWTSGDTSIVSVDGNGTVRTRAAGVTTVRAAFREAWGAATIRVLPGPEIAVSRDSVPMSAGAGGAPPDPEILQLTNGGGASLEGVSVDVEYPSQASTDWLEAALDGTTLPATLTLTALTGGLPVATYRATVVITAPDAQNSPVTVPVTLTLTGFTVRESAGSTSVNEVGGQDTIIVVLDMKPASDVVLTVASADLGEVDVTPRTLTFEPDGWDAPRTVTVQGVDDGQADGPQVTPITISVDEGKSDEVFEGLPVTTVSVTTVDDDAPGMVVLESGGSTSVEESGSTDDLTIQLASQPASDVRIDLLGADASEAVFTPASVTFTSSSWSTGQTVTVTGVDDADVDGDQVTEITLSVNDTQSDDGFDAVPDRTVAVRTRDDDLAGLIVTESGGTSVTEAGGTDELTVALSARPGSDVVMAVTSSDTGEMTVDPAALTFTPANWSVAQTVTATGVDDLVADGSQVTALTISVDDAASDDAFDAVASRAVNVTTTDDDGAALTLQESGGGTSVSEAGSTDDFTVRLGSQPLSNVVVDVASDDAGEATISPMTLTFTPASWAAPQSVTVTGVDDATADGPQTTVVTVSVRAGSSDPAYASVANETVSVTTTDDDVAGFTVTESGGTSVTEGGSTDGFTVVLTTQPGSNVVLTVTSADLGEAVVSPTTLTFTPADWSSPQSVTVTGVDDTIADADQVTTLTLTIDDAASDDAFDGVADQAVSVTTTDDDVAGFAVTESGGSTLVAESGGTDNLTVVLLAQPSTNVVLSLTPSDPGEATVSPLALTFTPSDWSSPQGATVTGVDDAAADGNQVTTLRVAVDDAGSDDAFDGATDQTVSVTTTDDDVAGFAVTESGGSTVVTESGGTDTLTVVLLAQPTANVVLSFTASDPGEATVSPLTLTFTPVDWSTPQGVTVTGVDDLFLDGDQVSTITVAVDDARSDDAFDGVADRAVSVTTKDNLIIISPGAPSTTLTGTPSPAYRPRTTAIASPYE